MKKLETMSLLEILNHTNIYLAPRSLYDIWKTSIEGIGIQKTIFNPEGQSALQILQNRDYADELVNDPGRLRMFLFEHEHEIDKVKFVMTLIANYKFGLSKSDLKPEVRKEYEQNLAEARKLLRGIDQTFINYNWEYKTGRITQLIITNTKDESEGRPRERRLKNLERLKAIEEDENLGNIVQSILLADVEHILTYEKAVGKELRFLIEYNSLLNSVNGDNEEFSRIIKEEGFDNAVAKMGCSKFVEEMTNQLRKYIEEIDIDKMLLCSAVRYFEGMEFGKISEKNAPEVYQRLQVIQKHLKKNAKLVFPGDNKSNTTYEARDFENDMKRFIAEGESIYYLPIKKCLELKKKILQGDMSLNDISVQIFEALQISKQDLNDILKRSPNNYIFFLRQKSCPYEKAAILRSIIDSKQCSNDLLQLLCEKTDITAEEICDLFDKGIISVGDLRSVRDTVGQIISDQSLFGKYQDYKEKRADAQEADEARIELERYALAYRNTELIGKTNEELEEKGEEFIADVGDKIEPADLVPLYGLDIIPLKVAVDWGGENIIEQLLRNETLKPSDARYLRDEGLLDEKVLERLFRNSVSMSYSYQVALVCTVFDGQTAKEQEIRERLAQYYHIENAIGNSSKKGHRTTRRIGSREENEPKQNVKMRDPGAKYNLLASLDKDVRIEEGIIDGHIIFHYPNIGEGTVVIEKLHKITTSKETGLIEIKADNESATYVMSEEEFIKIKTQLIKEGKVDRTELTQRWWVTRDPEHWIPHTGISGWERALQERFDITEENSRYSPEDLSRIEELISKSIESKKGEDR